MKDKFKFKKTVKSYEETGCHVLLRFADSDYRVGIFKLFFHGDRSIFGSLVCYRKTKKNYSAIEYTSKEWLVDFNPKKTECIICSTNQAANKPCIVFNNENVIFVENHKHLGITFSHNCKWHCHIENILKSTSSQLSMFNLNFL